MSVVRTRQAGTRRRSLHGQSGFTVVEMLVTVSILVMVTIPILMVLQSATTTEANQTDRIEAGWAGTIAAERISADVRSASSITITPAGQLRLTIDDVDGNTVAVTWERIDTNLVRGATVGAQTNSTVVLSDLSTVDPVAPFEALDQNGDPILTSVVDCRGYISVDIQRQTADGIEHLTFDVASRSLNSGSGSC